MMETLKETIRLIDPDLRTDLIESSVEINQLSLFLDEAFPVQSPGRFFDDFPLWESRHPDIQVRRWGVYKGGRLIASTGCRISWLKSGKSRIRIALIGAVATHTEVRGKGIASKLVQQAVEWARESGALAVFLWGSEHALYRKLGFELSGVQLRTPLSKLELPDPEAGIARGWNPKLFELLKKREGGLALRERDKDWWCRHKNVEWFWSGDLEAPRAYAAYGRGIDLKGMIHEWGGEQTELKSLLASIAALYPEAEILGSPWHFSKAGLPVLGDCVEYLCLAKILNHEKLLEAFFPDGAVKTEIFFGMEDKQIVKVLFGPDPEGEYPSKNLPVPLWFWGLDAV